MRAKSRSYRTQLCTVVGYGIYNRAPAARLPTLGDAFDEGIAVIRKHALVYFQAMMAPANRNRLVKLINADLNNRSSYLLRTGVNANAT